MVKTLKKYLAPYEKKWVVRAFHISFYCILSFVSISCSRTDNKTKSIMVFTKTSAFRHQSIEPSINAIKKMGQNNNFKVYQTEKSSDFSLSKLKQFDAVVFLNTSGDVLNEIQQNDFKRFFQSGKGWVGVHCATDTETDWPWYGKLAGAYFNGHPAIQEATLNVLQKSHLSTKMLPENWTRTDEWYNFKDIQPDIDVLITLDESSYDGGTNGENHPISWCKEFDGGRAFYTALGHTTESFEEELFLAHLLGGIKWSMGE